MRSGCTPRAGRPGSGCLQRPCPGAHSDDAFSTLLHGDTAVGSYLMGQALAYTAEDVRTFLLQTAVGERVPRRRACARTHRPLRCGVAVGTSALPAGFSPSAHGRPLALSYHPMFRALLLAELMRSSPEELRRLCRLQAAAWFSQQGEHIRAAPWLCRVSRGRPSARLFWPDHVWHSRQVTGPGSGQNSPRPPPGGMTISACCCHRS